MPTHQSRSGLAKIDGAQIYYEIAGNGTPLVMIHAGVADSRQWNNEFTEFVQSYRVLRYDLSGHGKSERTVGDFNLLEDLISLLNVLELDEPLILMGCSMGGSLAMDLAITQPSKVKALIMVGFGPSGLELDVPAPAKFADAEKAYESGDLDLLAELETQLWFDGTGRTPEQVDQAMRKLAYEMGRQALELEARQLGKRLPNTPSPTIDQVPQLKIPVLAIVGAHDTPYILAAADYMLEKIPSARKLVMEDAAHLPNMDHPAEFHNIVKAFLNDIGN